MPRKSTPYARRVAKVAQIPKRKPKRRGGAPRTLVYLDRTRINPFPSRFITKMHTSIYGSIPAGASSGQYFIQMNACRLPFDSGGWTNARPNIVTLQPTGYSSICNANMYQFYRVNSASVKCEIIPQQLADSVVVTLTPSGVVNALVGTAQALTMPWTKKGIFSSSKNNTNSRQGNAITNTIRMNDFFGVNKMIYDNELGANYTAQYNAKPAKTAFMVMNWATPDGVNTSIALEYRIDLTQYVTFFENISGNLFQT